MKASLKLGPGTFYGVGVGPGGEGLLPVAALDALLGADLIYAPRSRVSGASVALTALRGLERWGLDLEAGLSGGRVREVVFDMDGDDARLERHYARLADELAGELRAGRSLAYLTIGDSLTYSTLQYALAALARAAPEVPRVVFPGVTSYAAAAARLEFSLGEGKERTLVLPCPENLDELRMALQENDVVVLMKVGQRLPGVLDLLGELGALEHCALAHRLGLDGERLLRGLETLEEPGRLGYLTVMLLRLRPPQRFDWNADSHLTEAQL